MSAQIIEREGKPEYAVVPYNEYLELLALAEDAQDAADSMVRAGEVSAVPSHMQGSALVGVRIRVFWPCSMAKHCCALLSIPKHC